MRELDDDIDNFFDDEGGAPPSDQAGSKPDAMSDDTTHQASIDQTSMLDSLCDLSAMAGDMLDILTEINDRQRALADAANARQETDLATKWLDRHELADRLGCSVSEVATTCLSLPGFPLSQALPGRGNGRNIRVWLAADVDGWIRNDWVRQRKMKAG